MTDLKVHRDGAVGILEIDRPRAMNALTGALIRDLRNAVIGAAQDPAVRVAVITGAGTRAFSAGADLDELDGLDEPAALEVMRAGQRAFREIETAPIPVIAAVNGIALGGGFELILSCTFAVASESATFGLPESRLGLIPGYGGTQRLTPLLGPASAAYLMLTGERLSAQRAYELGLTPLAPLAPEELMPKAMDLARTVAGSGPAAVRSILGLLDRAGDADRAARLAIETDAAVAAIVGSESTEGVRAFRERRPPNFSDLASAAEGTR